MTFNYYQFITISILFSGLCSKAMTHDDQDRLLMMLKVLSVRAPDVVNVFTEECRKAISIMLDAKSQEEASTQKVSS